MPARGRRVTELGYEIRVAGLVPDAVLEELEGVHVTVQPVATVLRGPLRVRALVCVR